MATAEDASASVGPRYAPDDPTLPQPWKGLIDGSTGVLYYWNPVTNTTQYERPSALAPPFPTGLPPTSSSAPKLAPIPVPSVGQAQQAQPQTQRHQKPQMPQQTGQKFPLQQSQPMMQPHGHPMQEQTYQKMPQQQIMHHQNSPAPQQQDNQYAHPQVQYMGYQQQYMVPQGLQNSQHPVQQFPSQQDYRADTLPNREGAEFHQGKQTNFSHSHLQNTGVLSSQNIPFEANSGQLQRTGAPSGQAQQYNNDPRINMQHPATMGQFQQAGASLGHQQLGPSPQNQMDPGMMHKHSNGPPSGSNKSYDNNLHSRPGNDSYFYARKEGPVRGPQHHNLAAKHIETGIGGVPLPNVVPGDAGTLDTATGHARHGLYTGLPFPNNPMVRPPFLGSPDAANLSSADVYRQQHEVTATGENIPAPFITFEATGFPPEILRELHSAGFSSPTPIQAQSWPISLQSRDLVAIAKTGSGKTLGYLIPAFILLRHCRNNARNGPTVLVLAPTRELATQIQDEALRFGRSSRISCTCLYGGAPKGPQLKELERGADIVVATPGRLNDILEMKKIDFRQVSLLVLDEADRMLDMGFEPQIRKIVNEIPPRRQTLMYTATWPKEVRKIASDLLVNPVQVNIGNVDELAANKAITQYVEVVPQIEKERRLEQILRAQERGSKVIIFCSTKRLCDHLARSVGRNFGAVVIHGDKSQGERDWVLNQFRSGKSAVLIATDVAARGLDIKDIRVVINYDFPTGVEDYVHRIGRTGRAGATGVSYTFFSEQDWKYAPDLIKVLEGANQQVPPEVREIAMRGGPGFGKDRGMFNRFDSGGSRWNSGGMKDGGFGGRGGYGGRGVMGDDSFGRGNRGRGFGGGPGFGHVNGGRSERGGAQGRYGNMDGRGRGRGRGYGRGGRFDNRQGTMDRSRGGSYSRSPEMVRTWRFSRSPSHSRSRSRGRSRSRNWSRSRSYSRSRSRSRSWSRSRSRSPRHSRERGHSLSHSRSESRSPSCRYERHERRFRSGFDVKPADMGLDEKPSHSGLDEKDVAKSHLNKALEPGVSLMSRGTQENRIPESEVKAVVSSTQPIGSSEPMQPEIETGYVHHPPDTESQARI